MTVSIGAEKTFEKIQHFHDLGKKKKTKVVLKKCPQPETGLYLKNS